MRRLSISNIKIPTLLGLALLFTATFLGVAIYLYNQEVDKKIRTSVEPQNINIINITDTGATIYWQTKVETTGIIHFGQTTKLNQGQQEDQDGRQTKKTHFITINGLDSETKYNFKIKNGNFTFPAETLNFTTAKADQKTLTVAKPLTGKVVEPNLEPAEEGMVFLEIPGASKAGSPISSAGNFIIPLANLYTEDLKSRFEIKDGTEGKLTIIKDNLISEVKIMLPQPESFPPIILGQNSDFSQILAKKEGAKNNLDLNNDGKVNSVDLSIVILNLNKRGKNSADVNNDRVVDQKD